MALATTTVSGLVSGLDTASIIEQMMSIERRPIQLLENQMAEAEAVMAVDENPLALATLCHSAPLPAPGSKSLVCPDYGTVPARRKGACNTR